MSIIAIFEYTKCNYVINVVIALEFTVVLPSNLVRFTVTKSIVRARLMRVQSSMSYVRPCKQRHGRKSSTPECIRRFNSCSWGVNGCTLFSGPGGLHHEEVQRLQDHRLVLALRMVVLHSASASSYSHKLSQQNKQATAIHSCFQSQNLHPVSAEKRNANHERPARDLSHAPQAVSQRHCQSGLRNPSVEGMERPGIAFLSEVLLLGVNAENVLCSNAGVVLRKDREWRDRR